MTRSEPDPTVDSLLREVARAPDVELDELQPGSMLGPYELVALIGAGGMGRVFRARDRRLGRDVAIKVLPREYADNPERRRRFEQEARAAAAVDHPNLLAIHDAGTDAGIPYLVFELLEGETLRRRLARGPLPVGRVIALGEQLAHGLAAAHARGITHRDLKPENVFLTPGDRVKILDFGLAKPARSDHRTQPPGATAPGTVMGTVGYMSPEQVRGEPVDPRTDLFALGAILHEAITGRRAFGSGSAVQIMHAIEHDEPPPLVDAPRELDRIIRRCLAKHRAERYESAHDLAFHLEGLDAAAPPQAPGARWPWPARIALAAGLAAAGFAIATYATTRRADDRVAQPADPARSTNAEPSAEPRSSSAAQPSVVRKRPAGAEDRHWIQDDDFFISEQPWTHDWTYVHLAKQQQAATTASGTARFFQLDDSREVWTASYWSTHPAQAEQLAIGVLAICFNDNVQSDVYRAPATKDAARTGAWFLGKVTDTSDAAKGWVRIDTYNCAIDAVRVPR